MAVPYMDAIFKSRLSLTPIERLVFLALANHADKNGFCWPAIGTIARECGIAHRTTQYTVAVLKLNGLVRKDATKGGAKRTNGFTINLETLRELETAERERRKAEPKASVIVRKRLPRSAPPDKSLDELLGES